MEESIKSVGRFEYGKEHVSLAVPSCSEGQLVLPEFFVDSGPSHFAYDDPTWVSPNVQQEVMVVEAGHPFLWYHRRHQQQQLVTFLKTALGILGLIISLMSICYWFPLLTAQATITIIPTQKLFSSRQTMSLEVSPSATLDGQQVRLRTVPTLTLSQSVVVRATGIQRLPGTVARGLVTFLNWSWSERVVPAGTILTAQDGIKIVTDQGAFIPGAAPSRDGWSTVSAHAEKLGVKGNITPGDLEGTCCTPGVSYTNYWPFSGGQPEKSYSVTTRTDIDRSLAPLQHSLALSTQAALQAQRSQDETLLVPTPCTQYSSHSRLVGVSSSTVTLREVCRGVEAVNTLDFKTSATSNLAQQSQSRLGSRYKRVSEVGVNILACRVSMHGLGGLSLVVEEMATFQYGLREAEVQAMINAAAGQRKEVALHRLQSHPGVAQILTKISGLEQDTLPLDSSRISAVVMS